MSEDTFVEMRRLLAILPAAARAQMVAMYRASLGEQLASLGGLIESGSQAGPDMLDLSHKIAGSAAMMQDRPLSVAAREMETAVHAGRFDDAVRVWPLVAARGRLTLQFLREAG